MFSLVGGSVNRKDGGEVSAHLVKNEHGVIQLRQLREAGVAVQEPFLGALLYEALSSPLLLPAEQFTVLKKPGESHRQTVPVTVEAD